MKKKEEVDPLSWFDIRNYESILKLNYQEICEQLSKRHLIFNYINRKIFKDSVTAFEERCYIDAIFDGKPLLSMSAESWYSQGPLRLLTVSEVKSIYQYVSPEDSTSEFVNLAQSSVRINEIKDADSITSLKAPLLDDLYMCVNLRSYTDEEIIHAIRNGLEVWRSKFGLKCNVVTSDVKYKEEMIKKIKSYMIIPMMDIEICECLRQLKITHAQIIKCIWTYPNEISETTYYNKYRNLYNKVIKERDIRRIFLDAKNL